MLSVAAVQASEMLLMVCAVERKLVGADGRVVSSPVGSRNAEAGTICLGTLVELHESFASAPPKRSKYSIRIGTRCPAVRSTVPLHSVAACGTILSMMSRLFTHSRTPSSVVL